METRKLSVFYGAFEAIKSVELAMENHRVTALIGPSGCGKSTFLRALNRMNDIVEGVRVKGEVLLDGRDIYEKGMDVVELRKQVGMVFQKSNPFPKSIFDNVAYGLRINRMAKGDELSDRVEQSLRDAALWEEVKDRLNESALG
ncbi:MAG: ATP-binding cassette domain-containing protein, partial [Candidatus Latescibacteria bacterium]|nr:ATP-binding cassette domain-containing protein [Candidatus Latescibacterota bacterium]